MPNNDDKPSQDQFPARYANVTQVGYNACEFLLAFGQFYPDEGEPQFHTRIVTGPLYAKAFLQTLQASVEAYEAGYGVIRQDNHDDNQDPM